MRLIFVTVTFVSWLGMSGFSDPFWTLLEGGFMACSEKAGANADPDGVAAPEGAGADPDGLAAPAGGGWDPNG